MTDIHNLRGLVQISVVLICVGVSSVDTASVQTVDEALYIFKEQDNMGDEALELREEDRGYPDRCRLGKWENDRMQDSTSDKNILTLE